MNNRRWELSDRVAGVYTPAFVERVRLYQPQLVGKDACRRSLYSGLR